MKSNILIIYTGGTIGMWEDLETGTLTPLNFSDLTKQLPEIKSMNLNWNGVSISQPIDSAQLNPSVWKELVNIIQKHEANYDGFVILHGTDTMAYTASALSFMIQGLNKPIIITGSQLPMGRLRTDGKENFITAMEIASLKENGESIVQEVAICFGDRLMRGNRAWKSNTEIFNAIESPNFPSLAQIGTHIFFEHELLLRPKQEKIFHADMVEGVGVLKLYPGILASSIEYALSRSNMKVCIIESFGAGNVPSDAVFLEVFKSAIERGVSIVNISQCKKGRVDSSLYKTGQKFEETGAVFAADLTFEAAITKSMYLLSLGYSGEKFKTKLLEPIAGELTP